MQLNKILKGLAIALPVLALSACSSSDSATDSSAGQTTNNGGTGSSEQTTVVSPIDAGSKLGEQEIRDQQLRQEQTVYFAFDNSTISAEYQDMLTAHATFLSKRPSTKVIVEGHADERGTPEYNIALGERRATAVAKYLQALGVQADQISIVSYGEEKPLLLGQSEEIYAKNRRAVLVY